MTMIMPPEKDRTEEIKAMSIEELNFSIRTYNCLKRAKLFTMGDITKKTEEDLLRVRNLGKFSLDEIIDKLESFGMSLMDESDKEKILKEKIDAYLIGYINKLTENNEVAWVETNAFNNNCFEIFNQVYEEDFEDGDVHPENVYLCSLDITAFETYVCEKWEDVEFLRRQKEKACEILFLDLVTLSGTHYPIIGVYLENVNGRYSLYSFLCCDNMLQRIKDNNRNFRNLKVIDNDVDNLEKRIIKTKAKKCAGEFIDNYDGYLDYCEEKESPDWGKKLEILLKDEKELKESLLMKSSLGERLNLTVREYNAFIRRGIHTIQDAIKLDGDYYRRRFQSYDIIKLLEELDAIGLRIADADKVLYPTLDSYFKKLFICEDCGKELDYKNHNYFRRLMCPECKAKSSRLFAFRAINLRVAHVLTYNDSKTMVLFSLILRNNTNQPIKLCVDDVSLFTNGVLIHTMVDNRFSTFVEDYVFPDTERAFERLCVISSSVLSEGDYLTVYFSDKSNNKRYYFKFLFKVNAFALDDFYELNM